MEQKSFDQVFEEIKGKRILARKPRHTSPQNCPLHPEQLRAIPVVTATDVDKTSPAIGGAQELLLLDLIQDGQDDRIISEAKAKKFTPFILAGVLPPKT